MLELDQVSVASHASGPDQSRNAPDYANTLGMSADEDAAPGVERCDADA